MINKNKYFNLKLINFKIFQKYLVAFSFIKYLILISILATSIYLITPKFFDLNEKAQHIKHSLYEKYNIKITNYEKIQYNIFPTPRIIFSNLKYQIKEEVVSTGLASQLILNLNLSEIYKNKNFDFNKIKMNKSKLTIEVKNFKNFLNYLLKIKRKLYLENSIFIITKKKQKLIKIKKIKFDNKNLSNIHFNGMFENKLININLINNKNKKKLKFSMPEIGLETIIDFDDLENFTGKLRSTILDNNLQFNFKDYKNQLNVTNSFFRNKIIHTSFDGIIKKLPFFNFDLLLNIKSLDLQKLLNNSKVKDFISYIVKNKKFNGTIKINYFNKKYNLKLINKFNLNLFLENGDLKIENSIINFDDSLFKINGVLSEYEGNYNYKFKSIIKINNLNQFLKKLKIKNVNKDIKLSIIEFDADLNLFSNKININKIAINKNNILNQEERNSIKKLIEQLVIKDSFLGFFDLKKIKFFVQEVY